MFDVIDTGFEYTLFVSYCSIVKSENIEELVNLITTEPSEESEERVRYKYVLYFIVKFFKTVGLTPTYIRPKLCSGTVFL